MTNTTNIQSPITNNQSPISKQREFNIHKRIFNFVIKILKLLKELPKTPQNLIFINQITRSATSIGANSQEADGSISSKEFLRSMTITRKETKETNYWLKIIWETNLQQQIKINPLLQEGAEIEAIISSIIQKLK